MYCIHVRKKHIVIKQRYMYRTFKEYGIFFCIKFYRTSDGRNPEINDFSTFLGKIKFYFF